MGKRRKRQALRGGRRAAAGVSTKGGVSLGNSLESILDIVSEATRQVPERDWARLPTDLSKNVDHYLYGTKKKREMKQPSAHLTDGANFQVMEAE